MSSPAPANDRIASLSFWLLIGMIASIGAGKAVISDSLDPDLFWHLRVAEQLRVEGIHPIVDHLSFSSIKDPWTPYSWLAELAMRWMWATLGWRSSVACKAILVAGILVMIALCARTLAGRDQRLNVVVGTAFGAFLTIPFLSFRPATFAILLLGIVAWLLLRDRRSETHHRAVWLIVPLTILITNIHLSSIIVPIWVGCLLLGALIERKDVKHYGTLLIATSLACLATPMLAGSIRTAWHYQASDVMVNSPIIAEMRPLYYGWLGKTTVALLLIALCFAIKNRRRIRWGEWLWLIAAVVMTARLGRFAPMLAFIAAAIGATSLPLTDRALRKPVIAVALGLVLLIASARIIADFPRRDMPMGQWANRHLPNFPVESADFVASQLPPPRSHRLINEFNHGGYLEWRLGDRYQTFLDGRTQLFTPEFWRKTYLGTDADAAAIIRAADADAAIIPATHSQFRTALTTLGWQSVHRDDVAEVLVPPRQ